MAPSNKSKSKPSNIPEKRSLRLQKLREKVTAKPRYETRSTCAYKNIVPEASPTLTPEGSQPSKPKASAPRGVKRARPSNQTILGSSAGHSENEEQQDNLPCSPPPKSRRKVEKAEKPKAKPKPKSSSTKRTPKKSGAAPKPPQVVPTEEPKVTADPDYLPLNCTQVLPSRTGISIPESVVPPSMSLSAKLEDVGGLGKQINSIKESIVLPLLYPKFCASYNISSSRGVIFHGPPGTGKTLLARALAHECSNEAMPIAFFHFNSADILSKWVGEAESRIGDIFEAARLWQPSLVFFDEIDGLAPARDEDDRPSASLVSTLLSTLDGFSNTGRVLVVGSTNRLDAIDPALRRPGRFDQELLFPMPSVAARQDILDINTRNWQQTLPPLDQLAKLTSGFCGADLSLFCSKAAKHALNTAYPHALNPSLSKPIKTSKVVVQEADFLACLPKISPSNQPIPGLNLQPVTAPFSDLLSPIVDQVTSSVEHIPRVCPGQIYSSPNTIILEGRYPVASHRVLSASLHALDTHKITVLDLSLLATPEDMSGCKELNRLLSTDGPTFQPELFVIPDATSFSQQNPALYNILRCALLRPVVSGSRSFLFTCLRASDLCDLMSGLSPDTIKIDLASDQAVISFFNTCLELYTDWRVPKQRSERRQCLDLLVEMVHGWPIDHILQLLFKLDFDSQSSYSELLTHLQSMSNFAAIESDEIDYLVL